MTQREIKYRAWHINLKRMMEVYEVRMSMRVNKKRRICRLSIVTPVGLMFDGFKLMQYTGLKDKNGKEIYEGDIVHVEKNKFGKSSHEYWSVEFDEAEAKFCVYNQLNSIRYFELDWENHKYEDCPLVEVMEGKRFYPEVIGNIYENPELLKGKTKRG